VERASSFCWLRAVAIRAQLYVCCLRLAALLLFLYGVSWFWICALSLVKLLIFRSLIWEFDAVSSERERDGYVFGFFYSKYFFFHSNAGLGLRNLVGFVDFCVCVYERLRVHWVLGSVLQGLLIVEEMNENTEKASSCLAITTEKRAHRPGGCAGIFFQLFDWNRKFAKKKLFSKKLPPLSQSLLQLLPFPHSLSLSLFDI
jgi:hypothetical protein